MTRDLQIYDVRERALVRAADALLAPLRWWPARQPQGAPGRILLLRLERIGDLLMVREAIADARQAWPHATIDLAVGSWNGPIAALMPGISEVLTADAPWLARGGRATWRALAGVAGVWRRRRYDLVVNFEPDIRSNALTWLTRAPRRIGYTNGGGGALLTDARTYDQRAHVATNARRLIAHAAGRPLAATVPDAPPSPQLPVPSAAATAAAAVIGTASRPLVGVHVSGGRASKQWHLDRFAAVARVLATDQAATIVLTGTADDRPLVDEVARQIGDRAVVRADGAVDLPGLAALLARLDVFITSDTGPMHLAAAVGTPVVALFGPADPIRYGSRAAVERIVRVDLPCSPCGRVRLPPERCRGHVPDCMDGITVDAVVAQARDLLQAGRPMAPVERA